MFYNTDSTKIQINKYIRYWMVRKVAKQIIMTGSNQPYRDQRKE